MLLKWRMKIIHQTIKIIIDNEVLNEYTKYYFKKYPKRKVQPIKKPIPPSLNQWMVMPRMKANNEKQKWKEFIIWVITDKYKYNNLMIEKAKVTYTYYFPTKTRRDADNYNGKFINDGITESKLWIDDDFAHISTTINGGYDKKNPRVEILIEEM